MVGEYRIDRLLAEGGMGAVYIATHPMIGKRAAVKVMSSALCTVPSAVERFIQEARVVHQIGHRNIVDVFSFGELDDGRAFLVMEYVEGDCLADLLTRGPLPIEDVVAILDQVADAVKAAHGKGVVHRDLKPDNIMLMDVVSERRQVKLLDFGIAKLASPEDGGRSVTGTGLVVGTPNYMSPEQARGKGVDHRTDIYALGCVGFEMITGEVPYPADNAADSVIQHCQAPIPSAGALRAETPQALDQLIRSMLAKAVEDRPSLEEICQVLHEIAPRLERRSIFASTTFERAASATPVPQLRLPTPTPVPRTSTSERLGRQPTEAAVAEALAEVRKGTGRTLFAMGGLIVIVGLAVLLAAGIGPFGAQTSGPTKVGEPAGGEGQGAAVPVVTESAGAGVSAEPSATADSATATGEAAAAAADPATGDSATAAGDSATAENANDASDEKAEEATTARKGKAKSSRRSQRRQRNQDSQSKTPAAGAGDVDYTIDPF